jgi:putative glutamine amidotransferase
MPRIALTLSYPSAPTEEIDVWRVNGYLDAIRAGGAEATPLYLDEWETRAHAVVEEFDGLVLSGGADLAPSWYGQPPLENANLDLVNPRRPEFEAKVVSDFWDARKPVLGICYGAQFLNVWRGGALFQDLILQTGTGLEHRGGARHFVCARPDSLLGQILGSDEFAVPSYHHQAISTLAPDAKLGATACEDGTIEAVEWPQHPFFLGVQWHPERALDSHATQQLFQAFDAACANSLRDCR